jgi:ankyrin repeat protein
MFSICYKEVVMPGKITVSLQVAVAALLISAPTIQAGAIHDAVKSGDMQNVKTLIDGANELLNAQDEDGKTPLHHAVRTGNGEIARYLIERGADINLTDTENESPLHYAASSGNLDMAKLLLEKGATSLNAPTLVKYGGSVGKWTPLHYACLKGHPEMVKLLLDHGADIEARDGYERTPLILAAQGDSLGVVDVLVDRGANINAQAIRGYSALLWAARNRSEGMVDYLIEKNAQIPENMLWPALQMAVVNSLDRLYDYVQTKGFNIAEMKDKDPGFIQAAAAGNSTVILASLAEKGFSLGGSDEVGWTLLHYAASEGRVPNIEYLIGRGADINARNKKGESAFNLAAVRGFPEAAAALTTAGADTCAPLFPILEGPYMGQQPPGDTPEVFLPGIVSGRDRAHSSITFSPDGIEAYWTEMIPPEGRVAVMKMDDNRWSYPIASNLDRDPSFSPDGKRLYFIKTRPFKEGEKPGGDPDVKEEYWYMENTDSGWSGPISVGDAVNAIGVHWPCSIDKQGNLYFSEFAENMYCSQYKDGQYQEPVNLTKQYNNETLKGRSPFISPDGDYILFSADDGVNVSFKKEDGTWTDRINLGPDINASHENGCPRVTFDGKYLFFVSAGQGRPWGIYWVSAGVIDRLKQQHTIE